MAEYLYNNDDDDDNDDDNNNIIARVEKLPNFVSESPFMFCLLYYRNFKLRKRAIVLFLW